MERRLAAILAADVVGYSRLMGEDEAATLADLRGHREELFDPKAAQYRGRIVKLMGDGTLMEFGSVVAAVSFAVDLQIAMRHRNASVPTNRQIVFRIGINLGDIVLEEDDIFGDGVNVAARLEQLAEPGGICISRAAYDQVRDKLDLTLEDQGEVSVKNIARPVHVFRIAIDDKAEKIATPVVVPAVAAKPGRRIVVAAVVATGIALIGAVAWWQPWQANAPPATKATTEQRQRSGPSIAVLPFDNLSQDPEQDYFGRALAEDLITDLSKLRGLTVIARNSSFSFEGKSVDVRDIGEKLGVGNLVEGSVRKADDRFRINVQLIDTVSGDHIWAERWDRPASDIFAVQDEIIRKIIAELDVRLSEGEQSRRWRAQTDDPEAYDLYLRGRAQRLKQSRDGILAAIPLLKSALSRDPDFAAAWVSLGWAYWAHVYLGLSDDHATYRGKALEAAIKASSVDPEFGDPHVLLSEIALYDNDLGRATLEAEKAVELDPSNADNLVFLAFQLVSESRAEEGYEAIQRALRRNPIPPVFYHNVHGQVLTALGRYDEAEDEFDRCLTMAPEFVTCYRYLTAMHLETGDLEAAQQSAKHVLRLVPDYRISEHEFWHKQTKDPAERTRRIELLKSAGLPE